MMGEAWTDIGDTQRLRSGTLELTVHEHRPGWVTVVVETRDGEPIPEPAVHVDGVGRITIDIPAAR